MFKKTTLEKLDSDIKTLDKTIQNSNSFWKNFLRGLATGTGTAIGASIVAAVIIGIFLNFIRTAEGVPILNVIVEKIGLVRFIDAKK